MIKKYLEYIVVIIFIGIPFYALFFVAGLLFESPSREEYIKFNSTIEDRIVTLENKLIDHIKKPHVFAREK